MSALSILATIVAVLWAVQVGLCLHPYRPRPREACIGVALVGLFLGLAAVAS